MSTQPATPPTWERVHFVSNYFDGPLEGVVEFGGVPHVFFLDDEVVRKLPLSAGQSEEEQDFEVDRFYALHAVPVDILAELEEKNAIFERWHQAWSRGEASMKEHPALPADRPRYTKLQAKLRPWLDALRAAPPTQVRQGNFCGNRRPVPPGGSRWQSFDVQWMD